MHKPDQSNIEPTTSHTAAAIGPNESKRHSDEEFDVPSVRNNTGAAARANENNASLSHAPCSCSHRVDCHQGGTTSVGKITARGLGNEDLSVQTIRVARSLRLAKLRLDRRFNRG